jgi:hypothetical protein
MPDKHTACFAAAAFENVELQACRRRTQLETQYSRTHTRTAFPLSTQHEQYTHLFSGQLQPPQTFRLHTLRPRPG